LTAKQGEAAKSLSCTANIALPACRQNQLSLFDTWLTGQLPFWQALPILPMNVWVLYFKDFNRKQTIRTFLID